MQVSENATTTDGGVLDGANFILNIVKITNYRAMNGATLASSTCLSGRGDGGRGRRENGYSGRLTAPLITHHHSHQHHH